MLISTNLNKTSSDVSIKTRSTAASFSFKGQETKHTTAKWSIGMIWHLRLKLNAEGKILAVVLINKDSWQTMQWVWSEKGLFKFKPLKTRVNKFPFIIYS